MTMREEYEVWIATVPNSELHKEHYWHIYKDGWKAATELAVKDHAALCDRFYARGMNAAECAAAIRGA